MTTDAQIEANRRNAAASTGPNTPEGKSKSSRNAVSHGLFSTRNILNPDGSQHDEFNQLAEAMQQYLAPDGPLEQTLANEITRASWRLRRCARVEDNLFDPGLDPMENLASAPTQLAVDRARLHTYRILQRSIAELRHLQNERRFRIEVLPEGVDTGDLGLLSYKDLMPAMAAEKRWQTNKRKLEGLGDFESICAAATAPPAPAHFAPTVQMTKRSQSASGPAPNTPRNAPCPCGSGQKHKRCCGQNAPPVSGLAA